MKAGTMQVGVGDRAKWNAVRNLEVGDTATVPAGTRYYYRTKGQTWIAVTTTGPFVLTYANSSDDPSRSTPFGY